MNPPEQPMSSSAVEREVHQQPLVLERLLRREQEISEMLEPVRSRPPVGVLLVARGSSDNAATYGRYILEASLGCPASLAANSLYTRYGTRPRLNGWLAIGISQSGATPEVITALEAARAAGAFTLGITNSAESTLVEVAHAAILLDAGAEHAVPSTKTYTASLLALALIAQAAGEPPWTPAQLHAIPAAVQHAVAGDGVDGIVDRLLSASAVTFLGRGYLYGAALESALKLREMSRIPAEAWSLADYLHGPIAAAGPGTLVVSHVEPGPLQHETLDVIQRLRQRDVDTACISSAADQRPADENVRVPAATEALSAIVHAVRSQQIALAVARRLQLDPDDPHGLTKVTPTI